MLVNYSKDGNVVNKKIKLSVSELERLLENHLDVVPSSDYALIECRNCMNVKGLNTKYIFIPNYDKEYFADQHNNIIGVVAQLELKFVKYLQDTFFKTKTYQIIFRNRAGNVSYSLPTIHDLLDADRYYSSGEYNEVVFVPKCNFESLDLKKIKSNFYEVVGGCPRIYFSFKKPLLKTHDFLEKTSKFDNVKVLDENFLLEVEPQRLFIIDMKEKEGKGLFISDKLNGLTTKKVNKKIKSVLKEMPNIVTVTIIDIQEIDITEYSNFRKFANFRYRY